MLVSAEDSSSRDEKHFSLFSVVTFKNEECTSESTFSGGQVSGTCYTSTECSDKSGTKSGNCASGFGVCCVFVNAGGATSTISENRTYIQNPLYPAIETSGAGTTITYTINKCQTDICQVRLDFDNFVIAGPANTGEATGLTTDYTNCNDKLVSSSSSSFFVPTLCGVMSNEHIYIDMGVVAADTATLALTLAATGTISTANAMRSWRIKTSQIPCFATYRAPQGCHRYLTTAVGTIASPNFSYGPSTTSGANLLNSAHDIMGQDLRTCLRREKGMCCTLFQVCSYFDGIDLTESASSANSGNMNNGLASDAVSQGWSFHVDLAVGTGGMDANTPILGSDAGLVDFFCTGDYVEIPDSSTARAYGGQTVQANSRYCGTRFGLVGLAISAGSGLQSHSPVWDCSEPWEVNYRTNIYTDELVTTIGTGNNIPPDIMRGFCLDYSQQAC